MTTSDQTPSRPGTTPGGTAPGNNAVGITALGGSATPYRITREQRRLVLAIPKGLAPWLTGQQALRAAAQELALVLGVPVGFVGRGAAAWEVLGESREEASRLGERVNEGSTFGEVVTLLRERAAAKWTHDGREYTVVPLPVPASAAPVVLVAEGDWTLSASELVECAAALLASPTAATVSAVNAPDRLARQLGAVTDLAEACDLLLRYAVAVVPCRFASVAAPAADGTLEIVAAHGYPVAIMSHVRIESGRGVIGAVYERGRALLVRDIDTMPGAPQPRRRFRTKSCAAVPVSAGTKVLAVLTVADREDDDLFTTEDVERLGTLVAPAALALARLRTERKVQDLAQAAIVDPASGLFNRLYFQSRMQEELQRATRQDTPLSLQIIDVDTFKNVNDRFGHLAGDAIIKDVADILRRSVRVFDVCARYGGDEFAVVMPGSRLESALAVADRIRLRIEQRQPPLPGDPSITVSIGVAELQPGEVARDVIGRADRALYEAKRAGKNRVVATPAPSPAPR